MYHLKRVPLGQHFINIINATRFLYIFSASIREMTYANYKPNYGVSMEMKGKVSTSHQPTDEQDYYYSSVDDATNSIVTARTPSVQPATTNRVPNRHTENVISDSQLKTRFNTINDDINLLKKINYRLKIGLIISVFVIIVAIVAGSAMAVIFKQVRVLKKYT